MTPFPAMTETIRSRAEPEPIRCLAAHGADRFVFKLVGDSPSASAHDVITDFDHAETDKIDLAGLDAKTASGGDQAFAFIGSQGFHHIAGELHYTSGGGGVIVSGDVNGDGVADFSIDISAVNCSQRATSFCNRLSLNRRRNSDCASLAGERTLTPSITIEDDVKGAAVVAEILKREGTDFLACYPRNPLIDACAGNRHPPDPLPPRACRRRDGRWVFARSQGAAERRLRSPAWARYRERICRCGTGVFGKCAPARYPRRVRP
jgi:hypothetical protein